MNDSQKAILDAVVIIVDKIKEQMKFDYSKIGTVVSSINTDGTYDINYDGTVVKIKPRNGDTYNINDIVIVRYIGISSDKFIDCKR